MSEAKEALTAEQFLAMVDGDVNNIENLPDYIQPVPGTYMVAVDKSEVGGVEDGKPFINVQLRLISTVEQTGEVAEYTEGSPMGFRFYGDMGIKRFKKLFTPVFEQTGAGTISQLLDAMPGMELGIVTSQRKDRDDPEKKYADLKLVVMG